MMLEPQPRGPIALPIRGGLAALALIATLALAQPFPNQPVKWIVPYPPVMFVDLATGLQHIRAGKLRAIAVASPMRLATLPDVPTIAESGLPGFEAYAWQAVVAPAGTPPEIVARLNRELTTALNSAEIRKKLSDMGVEPTPMPSAQIADYAKSEALRWGGVINAAGIKLEQ